MEKNNLIYGLRDPRNDVYYYIGKTTIGNSRPLSHLTNSHNKKVNEWIKELSELWLYPFVDIIEGNIKLEDLKEREAYWIQYYYNINNDLFNATNINKNINEQRLEGLEENFKWLELNFFKIGNIIKEKRLSLNITQQQLADGTGLNRSTISQIECLSLSNTTNAVGKCILYLTGFGIIKRATYKTRARSKKNQQSL
jgi:hypothetical protein